MSGCKHENIEVGVYEYCVDCGAVKRTYRPGQFVEEEWHSCPKCALAAPIADLVAGRRCSRGGEGGTGKRAVISVGYGKGGVMLHPETGIKLGEEVDALREENTRLKARLVEMYERIIPEEIAKGLERLTRERDDALAEAKDWQRVAGLRPAELDAKLAEVARLERLILDWSNGVNFGGDALDEEARRIRAQREEEQHRKHPTGDYCVWCHSQWPCEESSEEGR